MAGKTGGIGPEQRKRAAAEEMWLKYYNRVLFEKGLITERERNLMSGRIDARTARSLSRQNTA